MITSKTILDMVEYWLNHPVNGKYGSDFGAPLYDLLMAPLDSRVADSFLIKMKKDLPILSELNSDQLALYSQTEPYRVCRRVNILRDYPDDKTKLYPRN